MKEIIIKRYLRNCGGTSPDFWDDVWREIPFTIKELASKTDQRLIREFSRHLPQKARILEGGCGNGAYVARFLEMGHQVIGVDFAQSTVKRLNIAFPDLDIKIGDIRSLPFSDELFDAYYSGGVIEHFEDGLLPQIKEAYRVLKPGGLFLVTVPYVNKARNISARLYGNREKIDLDGRQTYIEVFKELNSAISHRNSVPVGYVFHEYVLSSLYMKQLLAEAGFSLEHEMPFSSRWGLLDLEPVRRLTGFDLPKRHTGHRFVALLLRLVESLEKRNEAPFEVIANFIGLLIGNMKLYVARKSY